MQSELVLIAPSIGQQYCNVLMLLQNLLCQMRGGS